MDPDIERMYAMQAEILHAAGHPIRLAVISYLRDGQRCVCEIVEHVGAGRSNVSRHLSVLLKAGILEAHKDGLKMMYGLKTPCILSFLSCTQQAIREKMQNQASLLAKLEEKERIG